MFKIFRRWHGSSRVVKTRIAIAAIAALVLLLLALYQMTFFVSLAYDPATITIWPRPPRQFRLLTELALHTNPLIRIPFDAAVAGLFAVIGLGGAFFILWSAQWLFNLDRWRPPIEDRSHISNVNKR